MIYNANFKANNGTQWIKNTEDTNKWRLLKDVRETAKAERYAGNKSSFFVDDERGETVFAGEFDRNGVLRYSTYNYKEKW